MTLCCQEIICASKTVLTGGWDQRKRERTIFLDFFFLWDARDTLHLGLLRKAALRMQDSVILFLNAVFSPLSLGGGALSQRLRLGAVAGGRCRLVSYLPLIMFSCGSGI